MYPPQSFTTDTRAIIHRHRQGVEHPDRFTKRSPAKVFSKGPKGLVESEEGEEVGLGREGGSKVKWGKSVGGTMDVQKEGKFVWFGTISPGDEVV